jgi:hypothetical protein
MAKIQCPDLSWLVHQRNVHCIFSAAFREFGRASTFGASAPQSDPLGPCRRPRIAGLDALGGELMTFYRDLTPYEYGEHSFPRATPDSRLVDAVRRLAAHPSNLFRGFHVCEFCPLPFRKLSGGGTPIPDPKPGTTGNGEIRVLGADGVTFVAPVLIVHYITEHQYSPPQQFVDAVLGLG